MKTTFAILSRATTTPSSQAASICSAWGRCLAAICTYKLTAAIIVGISFSTPSSVNFKSTKCNDHNDQPYHDKDRSWTSLFFPQDCYTKSFLSFLLKIVYFFPNYVYFLYFDFPISSSCRTNKKCYRNKIPFWDSIYPKLLIRYA